MAMTRRKVGRFLGIPYDWRLPTSRVMKERMWNPRDRRVLTPHVFGWGWSINFYELFRRMNLIRGNGGMIRRRFRR
jgi:hypothetical protein